MKQSSLTISSSLKKGLHKHSSELAHIAAIQYHSTLTKNAAQAALADSSSTLSVYTGQPPEPSPQNQQSFSRSSSSAGTSKFSIPSVSIENGENTPSLPLLNHDGSIRDAVFTSL